MTTASPAPPETDLATALAEAFASFGPAYRRWVHGRLGHGGTSFPRMRLLHVLRKRGPQKMSALGKRLNVTPRNITTLVDALEADDLVRRRPHPDDRRVTLIELTPKGRAECESGHGEHLAAVSELFGALSEADQRELLRLLGLLDAALREREAEAARPARG